MARRPKLFILLNLATLPTLSLGFQTRHVGGAARRRVLAPTTTTNRITASAPPNHERGVKHRRPLRIFSSAAPTADDPAPPSPTAKSATVRQILAFSLPTLGIWIASLPLSLMDTAFVGRYATSRSWPWALPRPSAISSRRVPLPRRGHDEPADGRRGGRGPGDGHRRDDHRVRSGVGVGWRCSWRWRSSPGAVPVLRWEPRLP